MKKRSVGRWVLLVTGVVLAPLLVVLCLPVPYDLGVWEGEVKTERGTVKIVDLLQGGEIQVSNKGWGARGDRCSGLIEFRGFTYEIFFYHPYVRSKVIEIESVTGGVRADEYSRSEAEVMIYKRTGDFYTLIRNRNAAPGCEAAGVELSEMIHAKIFDAAKVTYRPRVVDCYEVIKYRVTKNRAYRDMQRRILEWRRKWGW